MPLNNEQVPQTVTNIKWGEEQFRQWLFDRQLARTDRYFLANMVLGYEWITPKVHQPMVDVLPKFQGGVDDFDIPSKTFYGYTPTTPIEEMCKEDKRNILILYPRGSCKTTFATVADTIQWIINYPDIRICIVTAVGQQGQDVFDEIRKHFQFSMELRGLFPELCPPAKKAADWGNQESFTILRRKVHRKEPTVSLISVGKVIAGYHYDVLKFSDVVDWTSVQTPGQILNTVKFANYCEPLIERYPNKTGGWRIVEGTPYDYMDYYGTIRDRESVKEETEQNWKILVKSAKNEDGTLLWPERITAELLTKIEEEDPFVAASQYYMNPVPTTGGLATRDQIIFTPSHLLRQLQPSLTGFVTIDLAGMEENAKVRNDDTVLNYHGWDKDGRCYFLDVRAGKYTPFQVIEQMFDMWDRYRPRAIKIEKDAHARVLLPFMRREMEKRGKFLTIVEIKRDNRTSKKQRIRGLQPWFQSGLLRFSDALSCKAELISQIVRFSDTSTYHDDILDTIADACYREDGGVEYSALPNAPKGMMTQTLPRRDVFLGFEPISGRANWSTDAGFDTRYYDPMTGAL
jgi:predicted phage terminase large subunit-like protein